MAEEQWSRLNADPMCRAMLTDEFIDHMGPAYASSSLQIIMARQLFFGESFNAEDEWRRLDASVNGDPMWGQGPPVPHPSWEIDDNQEDQQVSEEDSIDLTGPEYVAAADEDLVPRPYSPCPAFDVTSEDPNMEVRGHLLCFVGLHVYKNCLIPICTKKLLWLLRRSFITKTTQLSDG
ncbi:uncharacterized protein LOC119721327 isoform X4 [Patiria miniata]|uniref:Uncharacterized protein n=1 Tax=Patiria miniata TaxID=46514 RepID=A0A913Z6F2_PATMI|nr:uncharacterized protein LOC119721327 isoform X4 [Patiria miniata]